MRKFDMFSMTGIDEKDCEVIMDHIDKDIDLTVDDEYRVWNSGGGYIADCKYVGEGNGIAC